MSSNITRTTDDKNLVIAIRGDNKYAFKILFERYYKQLIDSCFYRVKNLDISKDLIQELFVNLWIYRNRLNPQKSIKAYLYRAIINKTINQSKFASKHISLKESMLFNSRVDLESQIDLFSAIETIPNKFKKVILLSKIENFKYSEIAEICNISNKAVEKRMTKALKLLRKNLSK